MVKIRRCFWVDDNLVMLITAKGVDPSTLINKFFAGFLDLPDDPRDNFIRAKTEEQVIRLRISYEQLIRDRIREHGAQQLTQDLDRARADQRAAELLGLGEMLQKTTCWFKIHQALRDLDPDSNSWTIALHEVNEMDGNSWDFARLWNTAVDWYKQYGKSLHA